MPLFRHLDDDAFLIFSRKHRHLYEASLLKVYDRFFSSGVSYVSPRDVVRAVYDLIAGRPDLLPDDADIGEGLPALVPSGRRRLKISGAARGAYAERVNRMAYEAYQRLVQAGWLEEEEYGLQVSVDMPMGALLVMQCLANLQAKPVHRFGGVVVTIKTSLEQVERCADLDSGKGEADAAHGLNSARQNAENFIKTLRAILSDLKRIRKAVMEAGSLEERFDTYFERFISELMLKDFESIYTTNHPFRHRDWIVSAARRIGNSETLLPIIASGYLQAGLAPTYEAALDAVRSDLVAIEAAFDTVEAMFGRIGQFRRSLEARLRNTVHYAQQGDRNLASRTMSVAARLDALLEADPERYAKESVRTVIEHVRTPWSESQLARPRQPRVPVTPQVIKPRKHDPIYVHRKRLMEEYRERINPPPERLLRFLSRMVPPDVTVESRYMRLETVDDFLAFDALRRIANRKRAPASIAREFVLWPAGDGERHDCDWIECGNFLVRHVGDSEHSALGAGEDLKEGKHAG
ncbi:hypothetical protein HBA54_20500 [Pelagibius litoralis]|uniref:Uncharacterized protein n=1 Tax=Pelagibius litoralis TaxID=374515 RepID=A0A967F0X0_9PROT|nr:Wadjet anti-phage system protein JetA family protein [Pelagibius litoralis]NIA70984.1 hypothetical protein [Pelagibius litoralis]